MHILFFDTETTGKWNKRLPSGHPDQPRIVQLGATLVDADTRAEVMRQDVIIWQDIANFSEDAYENFQGASAIHGLTQERIDALGVNENAALDVFCDMVAVADLIVAHNIEFDVRVINNAAQVLSGTAGMTVFGGKPQFCTMKTSIPICKFPNKNGFGSYGWPKLEDAVRKLLEREPTAAHSAIGDVIDCRDLFFYLQDLIAERQATEAAA